MTTDLPAEAVTADGVPRATMALRQVLVNHGCTIPVDVAREAAGAAAPHITAAVVAEAARRVEQNAAGVIAEAVAAERERCAQLADDEAERLREMGSRVGRSTLRQFAAKLREDQS